jgi:hypothetical protein
VCTTLSDARTLCAALCTSSSARQAILDKCNGNLQLQVAPESFVFDDYDMDAKEAAAAKAAALATHDAAVMARVHSQAAWLAEHGMLVGQLQMKLHCRSNSADQRAIQLAVGPQLKLRSLHLDESRNPTELLSLLNPSRLSSLYMQVFYVRDDIWRSPQLAGCISRLTALQELAMTHDPQPLPDSMGPAICRTAAVDQAGAAPAATRRSASAAAEAAG